MKFSRIYVLGILAFLALVFVVESRIPRRFSWRPSFSAKSEQPFGCQLFDSVLAATLPNGYRVTRQTLYQLKTDSTADSTQRQAVLVLAESLYKFDEIDVTTMLSMAERGDKILLVAESFNYLVDDTLGVSIWFNYYGPSPARPFGVEKDYRRDTLMVWPADSNYAEREFMLYPQLFGQYLRVDSDSIAVPREYHSQAHDSRDDTRTVAMVIPVGKGAIYLVSVPLLFTNYGILDSECRDFVMRVFNEVKDLPVVRTTAYLPADNEVEQSPLRFFLKHPPLSWAIYLALLTIVVFMLFTARRRQRAIPVVKEPANKSMEFVELIASLYEQRRDYRDLVLKKFTYFAEELRRELHIDITAPAEDAANIALLAQLTGIDGQELAALISDLRRLQIDETPISSPAMADYIHRMEAVTQSLS